ncbi:MAG: FAD-dependent oxidoreductase [Anaerolineae bacterium]|nr:FAD-dependent oxidoreductase [Anaerolineae bacterium]
MTPIPLGSLDAMPRHNEMQVFEAGGEKIVVARVEDEYFAFRQACSHYQGNLNEGVLNGHTVMCPLHHACFDIRSGLRTEPPALSNIPTYPLSERDGHLWIDIEAAIMVTPETFPDDRTMVIVGAGGAGEAAVEELWRLGFGGKSILIGDIGMLPIDRPNVSKDYLAGKAKAEWMPLRDHHWYERRGITLMLDQAVTAIQADAHMITLADGETLTFDKLLLATGAHPRTLEKVPGWGMKNIFLLREQADADRILGVVSQGSRAVIIGASFIGMEVASSLGKRGVEVTVVGLETVPFEKILGEEIGALFQQEHESNGVKFRLKSEIEQFEGGEAGVTGVVLKDGETLEADFVVVGVGAQPNTGFLKDSVLKLNARDGAVLVDERLETSAVDIYAAGDIARYDLNGESIRIEHWRVAQQQGVIAAHNMFGDEATVRDHVPFFWTNQWKLGMRYVGHATKWDEIVYRGKIESGKFIAFFVKDCEWLAAAGFGSNQEMAALEFIKRDGKPLSKARMQDADFDLAKYAAE